jgi:hypothetical protein
VRKIRLFCPLDCLQYFQSIENKPVNRAKPEGSATEPVALSTDRLAAVGKACAGFGVGMGAGTPRRIDGGLEFMRTQTTTKKDSSAAIVPQIRLGAPWRVASLQVQDARSFKVRFVDGLEGSVRFEPSHLTGVFEVLRDESVFRQAYIEYGAVTWPGELDLAPDAMYDEIKAHGVWVLR